MRAIKHMYVSSEDTSCLGAQSDILPPSASVERRQTIESTGSK
ncbi:uncharacterized protein CLUP02_00625 [Colletotrichum lupini]|uniref:Uncharacterized protein n=1 Tax=Colletotrichum lupini TaxID=145971 RepID=A0A9Q8SBF1_9PEZI|nr:uncharacterized protein CLUP02_00625 [Colletotrichum lupini]UQC73978.1 hypothetical protein CLUP02_00625 [Colletotrichum lupini]